MMSSATSIDQAEDGAEPGFRVWHFFVLLSFVAATVAVVMARQSTPEYLILLSLVVGAAGTAAYACYRMLAPLALVDAPEGAEPIGARLRMDLEREKVHVLRSIKELEFDRAMGKVSPADFNEMSGRLRSRAIGIMKRLEGGSYREIIERDLAARLKSTSRPDLQVGRAVRQQFSTDQQPAEANAPDLPQADANRPDLKVGSTGVCVCGTQHDADAKFCKACGARVA
jgi:hypothetical protein